MGVQGVRPGMLEHRYLSCNFSGGYILSTELWQNDWTNSFYANEPINPVNTTIKSLNSQRPNQLFGSIRVFQEDEYSHYNALTAILRQRELHGLSGQVSYTWSHDLDIGTNSNAWRYDIAAVQHRRRL